MCVPSCCDGFTITSPGVFRQGSNASVDIMLHHASTSTVDVTVQLLGELDVISETRATVATGMDGNDCDCVFLL